MATNMRVTTTQVLGTKLRIECSEHAPLSDIEILKLRGSLGLAAKVLEVAARRLREEEWPRPGSDAENLYLLILATHFRLDARGTMARGSALSDLWLSDRQRIATRFDRIWLGLTDDITIADAYGARLALPLQMRALKLGGLDRRQAELESRMADGVAAGRTSATFKEELEGARIQYERRQVGREFVQQTARVVGGTGFVKNLSPGADKRTDPLEPILPPETKGTIHINFHLLLGRAEFPMMSVAKTLIHEASHKFLDTFDYAYGEEPHYRGMTEAQALRNADSYALAAVSLYRQTLIHDASELKDHSV